MLCYQSAFEGWDWAKGYLLKGTFLFFQFYGKLNSPLLYQPQNPFLWCLSHSFPPPHNCLGGCLPWCCPCPCSQQFPLLTGDLMEHRSHTAGYVHTDVSPLVLFCPAPSDMDLYCLPDVALRVAAPLQFWVLCCHPPPPHFTSITCSFCFLHCAITFDLHWLTQKNCAAMSAFKALFCPASVSILWTFSQIPPTPFHFRCSHCFPILLSVP